MLVIRHSKMAFLFSQYESLVIFKLSVGGLLPISEVPMSACSTLLSDPLSFELFMATER